MTRRPGRSPLSRGPLPAPRRSRGRRAWYRWALLAASIGGLIGVTIYLGRCRPATYEYQLVVVNTGGAAVSAARTRPILGPPVTLPPGERVELPKLTGDEARQRVVYEVRGGDGAVLGCLTDDPEAEWRRLYEAEGVRGARLQSTLRVPESLIACSDPRISR